MKTSKLTLAGVAGMVLAVAALAGPAPGYAGQGYRSDGTVAVHYRDRDHYRDDYRYRDHRRYDRDHAYGRHYVAPPHRHYRPYHYGPRYYGPRYYAPRYYDDGRGVWDFTLRYHFYD